MRRIKEALNTGVFRRLYIFHGAESYLLEYYLGQLVEKVVCDGFAEFNLHKFDGREMDLKEFDLAINSPPVMAELKLVIINDFDIFKSPDKEQLAELLSDLPEFVVVVFAHSAVPFAPDKRQKLYKTIEQTAQIIEFTAQSESDLIAWVKRRAAAQGKELDSQTCQHLIYITGGLMTNMANEIDKLCAFSTVPRIDKRMIDQVVNPVVEFSVFKMIDAIKIKNFDTALTILDSLFAQNEEPIAILALLTRNFCQMLSARLGGNAGSGYVTKLWGLRSDFQAKQIINGAARFDRASLQQTVELCAQADLDMKSKGLDNKDCLRMTICKIAGLIDSGGTRHG